MKRLAILGSTGSIGKSALEVAAMHPHRFDVAVLAAATSAPLLFDQIVRFHPELAVVIDEPTAIRLETLIHDYGAEKIKTRIAFGDTGYDLAASHGSVDTVLLAMVGAAGLRPALAAIDAGKQIALANKETLVMAGDLVMERAQKNGVRILPVDSEHSAIFQCLAGNCQKDFQKVFLTASGGPFRSTPAGEFASIQPRHALDHPTWAMGSKISIDSATMMNKGLEIIEAVHLFGIPASSVEVLIHPQSIVHSMVGYRDGTVMAQMGIPDMKAAIAYALAWPDRINLGMAFPDFAALASLDFEPPDFKKFPSLGFAYHACSRGGTMPAVLNAANEVAVKAFLDEKIDFPGIFRLIQTCLECHDVVESPGLPDILWADGWARKKAERHLFRVDITENRQR
ncbi:MAG: 1-deoxy-D-xylulose-5-phosphate reductoisomerase [Desulfobacteraceae bacterium]